MLDSTAPFGGNEFDAVNHTALSLLSADRITRYELSSLRRKLDSVMNSRWQETVGPFFNDGAFAQFDPNQRSALTFIRRPSIATYAKMLDRIENLFDHPVKQCMLATMRSFLPLHRTYNDLMGRMRETTTAAPLPMSDAMSNVMDQCDVIILSHRRTIISAYAEIIRDATNEFLRKNGQARAAGNSLTIYEYGIVKRDNLLQSILTNVLIEREDHEQRVAYRPSERAVEMVMVHAEQLVDAMAQKVRQKTFEKLAVVIDTKDNLSEVSVSDTIGDGWLAIVLLFQFHDGSSFKIHSLLEWEYRDSTLVQRHILSFRDAVLPNQQRLRRPSRSSMNSVFAIAKGDGMRKDG